MLKQLMRKAQLWWLLSQNSQAKQADSEGPYLSRDLQKNLDYLQNTIGECPDLIIRHLQVGQGDRITMTIVYLDGLVDVKYLDQAILHPLLVEQEPRPARPVKLLDELQQSLLTAGAVKRTNSLSKLVDQILAGHTALLLDNSDQALFIATEGWEKRAISEPDLETVVRGPREGFVETLRTNTAMLRRKLRNPNLRFETMTLGKLTKTDVSIAYIKGVVADDLVEEIKSRLKSITIDGILESGYIEEFIEDAPFSPFPTVHISERPDVVASRLLEGRVAIFTSGTPIVLTVPMLFIELFQASEDYYNRAILGTMTRLIRYVAFLLSTLSPAVYVALTAFHHELIPTPLLITMAAAREGTPFPALVEALGMGLVFEVLREAGVRIPKAVGQTVSIVGALVIGQAAVEAGLVGAPMIIVVALTAISAFVVAKNEGVGIFLRFYFVLLAGVFGAYGIVVGMLGVLVHLSSIRSFGIPYLSPIAPSEPGAWKDVLVRVPWWGMVTRPQELAHGNLKRQPGLQVPTPPDPAQKNKNPRKRRGGLDNE